jgi:hypothetical protein
MQDLLASLTEGYLGLDSSATLFYNLGFVIPHRFLLSVWNGSNG